MFSAVVVIGDTCNCCWCWYSVGIAAAATDAIVVVSDGPSVGCLYCLSLLLIVATAVAVVGADVAAGAVDDGVGSGVYSIVPSLLLLFLLLLFLMVATRKYLQFIFAFSLVSLLLLMPVLSMMLVCCPRPDRRQTRRSRRGTR